MLGGRTWRRRRTRIKQVVGLRQFLQRGLEKVRTEWLWACTAFNVRKLIKAKEMLHAAVPSEPA